MKSLRKLYDWVLSWAHRPAGVWALALIAFFESSIFPLPPDILQMALCLSKPKRSFYFALLGTVGSVAGAALGYAIGYFLYETVGGKIIGMYHLQTTFEKVGGYYREGAFYYIFLAAFTPIPFKVFTITAGVYHAYITLPMLLFASFVGRASRFFLVGALIYFYGAKIKEFIDRYFNWLTLVFGLLLVGGFFLLKGF